MNWYLIPSRLCRLDGFASKTKKRNRKKRNKRNRKKRNKRNRKKRRKKKDEEFSEPGDYSLFARLVQPNEDGKDVLWLVLTNVSLLTVETKVKRYWDNHYERLVLVKEPYTKDKKLFTVEELLVEFPSLLEQRDSLVKTPEVVTKMRSSINL